MLLIYILIFLFSILIGYQLYLAMNPTPLIEGLENEEPTTSTPQYKPYNINDPNNSLILAQQNAGNIEVLKGRIDGLDGIKGKVDNMQQEIDSMQTQLDGLVEQQAQYAADLAGSTPPDVSGTDVETPESVEVSIQEEEE
jgi:hypothetical protein